MKKYTLIPLAALMALSSCGLKKEKITQSAPVKVDIMAVKDRFVGDTQTYSGTVQAGDGSEVSFSVPGTIKGIYVTPGQKVTKGQLLAELNSESLHNAANVALATLEEARDAYTRLQKLHDAGALPDIKWVEMQSKLKQAENAYDMARRALKDAQIYSPVTGVVAEKLTDVGQTVIPAMPVLRVVSLGDIKVEISVPETDIAAMKPGRKASIAFDALDGASRPAVLSEQGVVANPLSRAYDVKFRVTNADGQLRPGMLCTVTLEPLEQADSASEAIVLPPQSVLLSADNRNFVWTAKDGKATRKFVEIAAMTADGLVVKSGIQPGDSVIVAGMQKVSEGSAISL